MPHIPVAFCLLSLVIKLKNTKLTSSIFGLFRGYDT
jgi:hypothetical protein